MIIHQPSLSVSAIVSGVARGLVLSLALVVTMTVIGVSSLAQWPSPERFERDYLTIGVYSSITAITASEHVAYFGSAAGILRYDIVADSWLTPLDFPRGILAGTVRRLAASFDDEQLWAETDQGVFRYESLFREWVEVSVFPQEIITGAYVPAEPIHIAPAEFTYLPDGTLMDRWGRQFQVGPIYEDNNNLLWMAVSSYGPAASETNGAPLRLLPFGLLQEYVSALEVYDNQLYIGGWLDGSARVGLTVIDLNSGEFRYIEQGTKYEFPETDALTIQATSSSLWVGAVAGLFEIDLETLQPLSSWNRFNGLPHNSVNAIFSVGDTTLIGTESGLGILLPDSSGSYEVARRSLTFTAIYCLEPAFSSGKRSLTLGAEIRPRYVWIGAETGAYRLDLKSFKLKRLVDPEKILTSAVRQIRRLGPDLWLLADDGLVRLDVQTGETESFPDINRFSESTALAVNHDLVAVGSGLGLTVFRSQGKKLLKSQITVADGLPSNNITALEFSGDFLWIGTDRGLCRFWWNDPLAKF